MLASTMYSDLTQFPGYPHTNTSGKLCFACAVALLFAERFGPPAAINDQTFLAARDRFLSVIVKGYT